MGIRKGDQVVVISGKDKGKKGKVILVEDNRITVEGVNIVVKNKKARGQGQKSTREKKAAPIDISNVMILCKCGKVTRITHKINDKGVKNRVCVRCNEVLDRKFVKTKDKEKVKEVTPDEDKKNEDKVEKKPLVRREVKHTAESKIKKSQVDNTKSATGVLRIGGA